MPQQPGRRESKRGRSALAASRLTSAGTSTPAKVDAPLAALQRTFGNQAVHRLAQTTGLGPELLSLQRTAGNQATESFVREAQRDIASDGRQPVVQRLLGQLDTTTGGTKATTNWGQLAAKVVAYNRAVNGGKSLLRQTELLDEVERLLRAGKALDTGFLGFRHRDSRQQKRQAGQSLLLEIAAERARISNEKDRLQTIFDRAGDEIWRQYIDLKQQHFGSAVFDQGLHGKRPEPGYLGSMADAHQTARAHLGEKLTVGMYEEIHNDAYSHGDAENQGWSIGGDKVKMARNQASNEIMNSMRQPTYAAVVKELNDRGVPLGDTIESIAVQENTLEFKLSFRGKNQATVKEKLQAILDDFYQEVEVSDNPLLVIGKLHKRLEYLHPFKDANTRTNLVILNKVLVEYGYAPAILDEPNQSYLQTTEEWADLIWKGVQRWMELRIAQASHVAIPRTLQAFDVREGTHDRSKLKDDAPSKANLNVDFT